MMKRIHLAPRLYTALQDFVHQGHRATFRLLVDLLEARPGDTVVEVGCGTGILARHFAAHGFDYWGIDRDAERIEQAREQTPGAGFRVCDALRLDKAALPPFRRVFIHGVLHHMDDDECRRLLEALLASDPMIVIGVIEPFVPNRWWRNPLGALFGRLDEGRYVRSLSAWRALLGPNIERLTTRSLMPRWPVNFIDVRLRRPASQNSADRASRMGARLPQTSTRSADPLAGKV